MRILIVDDNPLIRASLSSELAEQGFDVLTASGTPAALSLLRSKPGINLVLSDIEMPGALNGVDLALAIQSEFPGVRTLVLSAYEPSPVLISAVDAVIAKPSTLSDITRKIRTLLGTPSP